MDPNAILAELRDWAKEDAGMNLEEARAMQLFNALDEWLSGGNFLPNDWQAKSNNGW